MFDIDNWKEILATIKLNKVRVGLTVFGVFWGIFMLIIMLGTGNGLQNGVVDTMTGYSTNLAAIWGRRTTIPYKGLPIHRRFRFNNDDIKLLKKNLHGLEYLAPRSQFGGYDNIKNVYRKDKSDVFNIQGDYPEIFKVTPQLKLIDGRLLNSIDIQDYRKVVTIGKAVYEILFNPNENPIGEYIIIKGVHFQVVGVYDSENDGDQAIKELRTINIPLSTFQKVFGQGDNIHWFNMTAVESKSISELVEEARLILAESHLISPLDKSAFGSYDAKETYDKIMGLFKGTNLLVWFVGIGTLLAGIIGISNIMLITVRERTKEIGIRKAIGASSISIIKMIIQESIFLTSLAGMIGLISGLILVGVVNSSLDNAPGAMFKNPSVELSISFIALFILILGGLLAGIIPAINATRIKPIEALRTE